MRRGQIELTAQTRRYLPALIHFIHARQQLRLPQSRKRLGPEIRRVVAAIRGARPESHNRQVLEAEERVLNLRARLHGTVTSKHDIAHILNIDVDPVVQGQIARKAGEEPWDAGVVQPRWRLFIEVARQRCLKVETELG